MGGKAEEGGGREGGGKERGGKERGERREGETGKTERRWVTGRVGEMERGGGGEHRRGDKRKRCVAQDYLLLPTRRALGRPVKEHQVNLLELELVERQRERGGGCRAVEP